MLDAFRESARQTFRRYYEPYSRWTPILFFLLGFVFDAAVLRRPDELLTVVQQAVYILVSFGLVAIDLVEAHREVAVPRWLTKIWKYREALLHFLMGTLLNAYTIFFFKSASALTSFFWIGALIGILIINEFKHFGKFQAQVHVAILSLCLICYLAVISPLAWGFMGYVPFFSANVVAVLIILAFDRLMKIRLAGKPRLRQTHIFAPFALVQIIFIFLYLLRVLPPVPLSASYMGIFHDVKKGAGEYELVYTRDDGRFWQHGDQTFAARTGDVIHCFVRVFAPTRFKDELKVRWLFHDPRHGWQPSDAIPLNVVGGREEGFRGFTRKTNYQPGEWRVQLETSEGREIGRIGFTVVRDDATDPRPEKTLLQ